MLEKQCLEQQNRQTAIIEGRIVTTCNETVGI